MSAEIAAAVESYIVDEFLYGEGPGAHDTELFEERIIDSFGFMQILGWIGEVYGVEVEMRDITMENFSTVTKIAAYVGGRSG